ncbi:MAG: JAB domain-containing protein [Sphingobium sp.]|uniref:JAB domain-containing protein n=1 Tax=Sphingobium sp. TaxID=1912891 RepID=UPI0029AD944D|nr:JAB domain-containing protein [Sphingobium sp.]MDX3911003.1 JAB domain-containing protein [Sphingobium sp.]
MSEGDGPAGREHDGVGHRARLRQRLADGGPDALLDHELVEYLLALAIPRRDTKPLAKALLHRFGGFGGLMTADWRALAREPGMGDTSVAAIKIAQAAALRLLKAKVVEQPVLSSWDALLDYLRADMAFLTVERVRVLHLNSRNMLIRDEHMGDGSVDEAAIYTREVIRKAIDLGSTALILVHNHPTLLNRSRWITHKHAESLGHSRIFGLA